MFARNLKNTKDRVRASREGVILILALWIIVMLSLFALALAYKSRLEVKSISYELDELKAHYITKAASRFILAILSSEDKNYDLKSDFEKYISKEYSLGEGKFSINYIQDEESKININTVPFEVISYIPLITSDEVVLDIEARRPFRNLETLMLIDGIDENILDSLSKNWVTVYGDGKINFNTTSYYILNTLKVIPELSIDSLEEILCKEFDEKFSCCKVSNITTSIVLPKESLFEAINSLKNKENVFFTDIDQVKEQINASDIAKQGRQDFSNILEPKLYDCCILKYSGKEKKAYCDNWSREEAESISQILFSYMINSVFKFLDVKSNNYKVNITGEADSVRKSVTFILDRLDNKVKYWYFHYYQKYQN